MTYRITLIGGPLDGDVREVERLDSCLEFLGPPPPCTIEPDDPLDGLERHLYRLSAEDARFAMMANRPARYLYVKP